MAGLGDRADAERASVQRRRKADLLAASSLLRLQAGAAIDEIEGRVDRLEAALAQVTGRWTAWRDSGRGSVLRSLAPPVLIVVGAAWLTRRFMTRFRTAGTGLGGGATPRRTAAAGRSRAGLAGVSLAVSLAPTLWRWARTGRRLWWAWQWWQRYQMPGPDRVADASKDPEWHSAPPGNAHSRPR
jgi:hypothetical protein